jgi:hypothetical protein
MPLQTLAAPVEEGAEVAASVALKCSQSSAADSKLQKNSSLPEL